MATILPFRPRAPKRRVQTRRTPALSVRIERPVPPDVRAESEQLLEATTRRLAQDAARAAADARKPSR